MGYFVNAFLGADKPTAGELQFCVHNGGVQCFSGNLFQKIVQVNRLPEKQLKNARHDLPAVAELGANGIHFSDVISLVVPDSCWSADHSCTTARGIALTQQTMRDIQDRFGAFSSEGCMDFFLKELDFGLYVSIADGGENPITDTMVPFFELTYHGIVLYNPSSPTVNYPIKSPADQLTFRMRGGRPTFYFHSKFRYADTNWMGDVDLVATDNASVDYAAQLIADSIRENRDLSELQLVYMQDYTVCGNGVEVVTYCNGTRIVGNFSAHEQIYEGVTLAPFGYAVLK